MIVVNTTVDSQAVAETLMQRLIQERVAACATLSVPCRSLYRWKGEIESASEWLLSFKTRRDLFEQAVSIIQELHPYELPEIIATPIICAEEGYAAWIRSETSAAAKVK